MSTSTGETIAPNIHSKNNTTTEGSGIETLNVYNLIIIERFAYSPDGTFGKVKLPNISTGLDLFTVERPWLDNARNISCIPEGLYKLNKSLSPTVSRITDSKYSYGYEIANVPNRSHILIHPGNWPSDFQGCIGVGDSYAVLNNKNGVTNSRKSFVQLVNLLDSRDNWEILIKPRRVQNIPVFGLGSNSLH